MGGHTVQTRTVCNDLWKFHTNKNEWNKCVPSGIYVPPRKSHAVCMIGKYMIVNGGIDSDQKMSNDFYG